jgi:pimeloyl-ACP methyl ester carboxylesterase
MIKSILLVVFVIAVSAVGYQLFKDRDIPLEVLKAKYSYPHSQFIEVDGINFHVLDEGNPADETIVLIHGHFGSVHLYDAWAAILKEQYRVVRFDITSHGLTGPDSTGDYTRERTTYLTEQLLNKLDLDTFHICGTSTGGSIALYYAAKHPGKVLSLTLQCPGAMAPRMARTKAEAGLPLPFHLLAYITPRSLWSGMLKRMTGERFTVTDELIDRYYELERLEGQRPAELARMAQTVRGNVEEVLGSVTVPTLIQWGEDNPQLPVSQADDFARLMTRTAPRVIIYPKVGHVPPMEIPEETANDFIKFITDLKSPGAENTRHSLDKESAR